MRRNTIAFGGGVFGDEGKGRIVDKYVNDFAKKGPVIVYRDNGGAGSGHTVELDNGTRIAFHQMPAGVFVKNAIVIAGKGMVIHPSDFVAEMRGAEKILKKKLPAKILIDEMAVLSLDTHRAFEAVLKLFQEGSRGSTGRGMSPAYADVLFRHPLRMRDLVPFNTKKLTQHYRLYTGLLKGLGAKLSETKIPWLKNNEIGTVGTLPVFLERLRNSTKVLAPHIKPVYELVKRAWNDKRYSFVFEKAQGVGLDPRWGVYPDVTSSDTTFAGISYSTEGIVDPMEIEIRAAVIKATYMSSVGTRTLPTTMSRALEHKIREDANEYGATTKRPRDIVYLDLVMTKFFAQISQANALVLTHMDIVYPNLPIKVCIKYTNKGKEVGYRPDQLYLDAVTPKYIEFETWDVKKLRQARSEKELPSQAKKFLRFISKEVGLPIHMITTGPKREQGFVLK